MTPFDHDFLRTLRVRPEEVTEPDDKAGVLHSMVCYWKEIDELHVTVEHLKDIIIALSVSLTFLIGWFLFAWHAGIIEVIR
jgi:hypothetical protein